ncbi:MAG: hypothetical protein WA220_04810 [Candidatus Nitrosopolaris sp.]
MSETSKPAVFYYTFLYHNVLYCMRALSRNLLTEIKDNLDKNQKARNELYDLLDKAYYVDSLKYKIDDTTAYLESSSE